MIGYFRHSCSSFPPLISTGLAPIIDIAIYQARLYLVSRQRTENNEVYPRPFGRFVPPSMHRTALDNGVPFIQRNPLAIVQLQYHSTLRDDPIV
jgi:hypothetical protein